MSKNTTKMRKSKGLTGETFDALPDAEKERIYQEIDGKSNEQLLAESRPLNAAERARWKTIKKKMGRPKLGKGSKVVSLSVEKGLLKQIDAYAKANGLGRSELFVRARKR